jgi:uncharacterized membrane-anchored protein YjiN (DUF445 family)
MTATTEAIRPPSRTLLFMEGRALWELGAFVGSLPLLNAAPRGDGHPVLVLPGLIASDVSTRPLRAFLRGRGYAAHGWGLGRNLGPREGIEDGMRQRLLELHQRYGRKVSLIGWSLGGVFARELAKQDPQAVRQVITLGSPFAGDPRATNAWRVFEWASGQKVPERGSSRIDRLREKPPVPSTAIYSRTDGICAWQACREDAGPQAAIVPRNQARIADSLGEFIERHFLADQPIATKLREVDFAAMIADWLADRRQSDDLARFVLRLLPQALNAMDGSGLRGFLAKRVVERLETVEIAPLAAGLLDAVTHDRRHQRILDELLVALGQLLNNAEALDAIRDKIRAELPTLFRLFQADGYVLRKLVTSVSSFLEEVRADESHAVRGEFDRFIATFIDKLRTSPDYAQRLDGLRKDLLARPEIRDLAEGIWESVRGFIEREAQSPSSMVRGALTDLLVEIGAKLREDPSIRADINEGMVTVLRTFVANQKSGISRFVADQVKSWQVDRLIHMIELNVGRDLQYIRFNGALIGGLAGLVLHTVEVLVRST